MELEHLPGAFVPLLCVLSRLVQEDLLNCGVRDQSREHSAISAQTNNNNKLCPALSVILKIRKKRYLK